VEFIPAVADIFVRKTRRVGTSLVPTILKFTQNNIMSTRLVILFPKPITCLIVLNIVHPVPTTLLVRRQPLRTLQVFIVGWAVLACPPFFIGAQTIPAHPTSFHRRVGTSLVPTINLLVRRQPLCTLQRN
jgi:hypothetical protein